MLIFPWHLCSQTGKANARLQEAMQIPYAALQATMAAGTPKPPVVTPATPPAPETHVTHKKLHPD